MPDAYRPQVVDFAAHGVTVLEAVEYGRGGDKPLLMDCIYLESTPAPRPVVVWMHGGAFASEDVTRLTRPEQAFLALAQQGYLMVSIDYRLAQEAPFPAQIQDAKCAVRFLKANAERLGVDPDRIAVWGESCGGQLAGLMAVTGGIEGFEGDGGWNDYSSDVAVSVAWNGGYDMSTLTRMQQDPVFILTYGGTFEEKRELVMKASPVSYVQRKTCPFLAMYGEASAAKGAPESQSEAFCEALRANGNDAEAYGVPGQGHGFFTGQEHYDQLYAFLNKHLQ